MKNFLSAIAFLTVIPLPGSAHATRGASIAYFPLVGLAMGGINEPA